MPSNTEAKMAYARISHKPLEVGLRKGHHRAVENAGCAEPIASGASWMAAPGNSGTANPQQPIGTRLQEQAGQDYAAAGRRFRL